MSSSVKGWRGNAVGARGDQRQQFLLGEELDKRNFRRKILQADIPVETGGARAGEGRPARLYRYREDAEPEIKARRLFP